jgi:quinol monooxygenase YgiN
MYLVQETFHAKPGKAKELVKKFKAALPHFVESEGGQNFKIMTDITGNYWTVVMSFELSDIGSFVTNLRSATASAELQQIMAGYLDLVEGGHRTIYLLEE